MVDDTQSPPDGQLRAKDELAGALRALRRATGLTLATFEQRTGLTQVRVTAIEGGHQTPTRDQLYAYLESCEPDEATRRAIRALWTAVTAAPGEDDGATAELMTVVDAAERNRGGAWLNGYSAGSLRRGNRVGPSTTSGVDPGEPRSRSGVYHLGVPSTARVVYGPEAVSNTTRMFRERVAATLPASAADEFTDRLSKPAWRRSVAVSQADPSLWPDPAKISTVEGFTTSLKAIKESTGLSYEALSKASQRHKYPLARSTVHALCTKEKLPPSSETVACFITICGGKPADVVAWRKTWQRLAQGGAGGQPAGTDVVELEDAVAGDEVVDDAEVLDMIDVLPALRKGFHQFDMPLQADHHVGHPRGTSYRLALTFAVVAFLLGLVVGALLL